MTPLRRWWPRPAAARRARVPTVLQMEAVECGAACLAMVMAYYGLRVPLEVLRVACGVSRDGTNAANMLKAARRYGMDARGYKKEIAGLRELAMPVVLFWNFNHFVVLESVGRDHAWICDPASGRRRVDLAELDRAFTGVVLVFRPGEGFEPGGERPGVLGALSRRLEGARTALAFVTLAGLALVVPGLVIPVFARVFVDELLVAGLDDWLRPLLLGMALTALLRAVLTALQQRALLRLETRIALKSSAAFLWHVMRLPMEFFSQRLPGEITSRVASNFNVARLLGGDLAGALLDVVMIGFYAALMVQYDALLTVVGVCFAGLNLVAVRVATRQRAQQNVALIQESGKLYGISVGGLGMIETLKATGSEPDFFARWSGQHAKVVNAQQSLAVSTQLLQTLPGLLGILTTLVILSVGALRVMDGILTMGMLVAFQSLMASFLGPVNGLVSLGGALQEVQADLTRLDDVFRYEPELDASGSLARSAGDVVAFDGRLEGAVELRGVTFGYSRFGPPVVKDVDLRLAPGSRVALVGESGSGKSTVARLVAGLFPPWEGDILLDDMPRDRIPREVLAESVAIVSQEVTLFEGTLRDNLTLWNPGAADPDVVAAAKDAAIHDEIATRADGYDGRVDEGGQNFSGGQRQRLEIARALVGRPSVLVLDEATSALDPLTEKHVDDQLRRRGCTCLVVAHRLSTIRDCDEIVVMHRGRIVERGTHDALLAAGGAYARLVEDA